jgi:hypothetical protein
MSLQTEEILGNMIEYTVLAIYEKPIKRVQPRNGLALRIHIYKLEGRSVFKIVDTQSPWIISSEMEIIPMLLDISC